MSLRVYDLVETVLRKDARFSRNRHFDAHQDAEFSRAMRIAKHLETIIAELGTADGEPDIEHDGGDVLLRYRVIEPQGTFTREARLSTEEWRLLTRYAPGLGPDVVP